MKLSKSTIFKLTLASATINLNQTNADATSDANQQLAESLVDEWCLTQDPNSLNYVNQFNPACENHFPDGRSGNNGTLSLAGRKLKNLKMLILWLQPEHRFARYCYYGCWCLPDLSHADLTPKFGVPIDPIDSSCKHQSQCYDCAKMDHGDECISDEVAYKYELVADPTDPDNHLKKTINCLDDPNKARRSCNRAICECDKKLAEDLRTNYGFWVEGHHQEQGGFDTSVCQPDPKSSPGSGTLECCGKNDGVRLPFRTGEFGQRGCCGSTTFDSTLQECCSDDDVRFIGAC